MRLNSRFFAAATLFACIALFGTPRNDREEPK